MGKEGKVIVNVQVWWWSDKVPWTYIVPTIKGEKTSAIKTGWMGVRLVIRVLMGRSGDGSVGFF